MKAASPVRLRPRFDIREAGRPIVGTLVAVLAVNVLATVFLVQPARREMERLRDDSQPRVIRVRDREKQVVEREKHLAALRQAESDLDRLRGEVLATRERRMIEVQLELARLAKQFGINLARVQYENQMLEEYGIERFAMVVPLEGGYTNLRKFMQAVEDSKRYLLLDRVALAEGADGGQLLSLNVTLATYFSAGNAEAPSAAPSPAPARRRAGGKA